MQRSRWRTLKRPEEQDYAVAGKQVLDEDASVQ